MALLGLAFEDAGYSSGGEEPVDNMEVPMPMQEPTNARPWPSIMDVDKEIELYDQQQLGLMEEQRKRAGSNGSTEPSFFPLPNNDKPRTSQEFQRWQEYNQPLYQTNQGFKSVASRRPTAATLSRDGTGIVGSTSTGSGSRGERGGSGRPRPPASHDSWHSMRPEVYSIDSLPTSSFGGQTDRQQPSTSSALSYQQQLLQQQQQQQHGMQQQQQQGVPLKILARESSINKSGGAGSGSGGSSYMSPTMRNLLSILHKTTAQELEAEREEQARKLKEKAKKKRGEVEEKEKEKDDKENRGAWRASSKNRGRSSDVRSGGGGGGGGGHSRVSTDGSRARSSSADRASGRTSGSTGGGGAGVGGKDGQGTAEDKGKNKTVKERPRKFRGLGRRKNDSSKDG